MFEQTYTEELQHYGVPGMRWGVRKDIQLIANRRRNSSVREAKARYKTGQISKETRDARIKQANAKKKTDMDSMTKKVAKSMKDYDSMVKAERDIAKTAAKEVPNHKVKKGAAFALDVVSGYRIGGMAVTTAIGIGTANPIVTLAGAAGLAAEAGARYVAGIGLDKLS